NYLITQVQQPSVGRIRHSRYPAQGRERAGYSLPGGAALARACGVEQLFDNSGSAAFRRPDKA
ncbi:TPA: hypothetical protein ACWMF8_004725, partial [Klebsiella quasipneumoniae]